jgi:two-component system, LuxR family, response regulator FixJ
MGVRIHIIDHDSRRRASIAREFLRRGFHAEIYEDLAEFRQRMPMEGYVFAHDDVDSCDPGQLRELMGREDIPLPTTFYSTEPAPERIVQAMQLGAWNYLKWPFEAPLLDSALMMLAAVGERLIGERRRRSEARAKVDQLTGREKDVLELLVKGSSNKAIAIELEISPRTVEIHRGNMMRKLRASSTSEAVRIGLHAGIDAEFAVGATRELAGMVLDRAA